MANNLVVDPVCGTKAWQCKSAVHYRLWRNALLFLLRPMQAPLRSWSRGVPASRFDGDKYIWI